MAPFPTVAPTNDPNYLGYSRAISQPETNKSMEQLFSGISNTLNAGIKGLDFVNKENIDKQLYEKIDKERSDYTMALEGSKDQLLSQGATPSEVAATDTPATDFSGQKKKLDPNKVPLQIKQMDSYVDNLAGAYQAGKISNTYYYSRLNAVAKDLRSQYPGYREYIDAKISSITGVNPANAMVNALVSDINRLGTGKDKDRDRLMTTLNALNKEGVESTNFIIQQFRNGNMSVPEVESWVNEQMIRERQLKLNKAEREERKGTREEVAYQDKRDATFIASDQVNNYLKNLRISAGFKTVDDIRQRLFLHQTGKEPLNTEEVLQLGQLMQAYQLKAREGLTAQFKERRKDGTSIEFSLGGPGETAKFIDEALYPLKHISQALQEKDIPAALYGAKLQESIYQDGLTARGQGMLRDQNMRRVLQLGDAIKNMNPEFAKKLTERWLLDNTLDPFKTWIQTASKEMIVQPDARLHTAIDKIDQAKQQKIPLATVYDKIIKQSELISDPQAPVQAKVNMTEAFFDPKNLPMLTRFEREVTDKDGKTRPGQNSVFTVLTRQASDIKKISETPEGKQADIWNKFENWTAQSYKHLFGQDVKDLSGVELPKGAVMAWDSDTNRFKVMYKGQDLTLIDSGALLRGVRGGGRTGQNAELRQFFMDAGQSFSESLKTVNKINASTTRLAEVAKLGGKDAGAFIINTLGEAGFAPNADNTYIPTNMAKSIFSSRLREQLKTQDEQR